MSTHLRDAIGREKLNCEESFGSLQHAIREIIRNKRISDEDERLGELIILERTVTNFKGRIIRNVSVRVGSILLNMLIGLKCMSNVARFSVPQRSDDVDEIVEKVNECLDFCNKILENMEVLSTEEFIECLCEEINFNPKFLTACQGGLFDSLSFISSDEGLMVNCLKTFFETYLQQKETLKLQDFIRPNILDRNFLRRIAENIAEEDTNILFDIEREKLVKINFLLKKLKSHLEKMGKLDLEDFSEKMDISLNVANQIALKFLKEELEEKIFT